MMTVDTYYDPDNDVIPRGSPAMMPINPNLRPSPSPPLEVPKVHISPPSSPPPPGRKFNTRQKNRPSPADGVLISSMDGNKHWDIPRLAAAQALASSDDEIDEDPHRVAVEISLGGDQAEALTAVATSALVALDPQEEQRRRGKLPQEHVYYSTLGGYVSRANGSAPYVVVPNGQSKGDTASTSPGKPRVSHPRAEDTMLMTCKLPSIKAADELAPIQQPSPESEKLNGNVTLPSISDHLGDLKQLAEAATTAIASSSSTSSTSTAAAPEKDQGNTPHQRASFSQSPPRPPLFAATVRQGKGAHASPPISPNEGYGRELPTPGRQHVAGGGGVGPTSPYLARGSDRKRSSQAEESTVSPSEISSMDTPGSDLSASAGIDRMSIDGITNPQMGGYQCPEPNCTALPFHTPYLLNSHANVHSSNRPHYCSVKGCKRSVGGKGFKRKNEMIRHGLVHESPGYVCPFCDGEREHRYPRPDNLLRHVRVHHEDRDKEDSQLREVLAQRLEGPSKGRRRRGATQ